MSDLKVGDRSWVQLYLSVMLGKFYRVSEGPLMSSDFAHRRSHENSTNFIDNEELSDVVGVGPHHRKLLSSPFSVEFSDAVGVANGSDVEDWVEAGANALAVLAGKLEQFMALAGHDHSTTVAEDTLQSTLILPHNK